MLYIWLTLGLVICAIQALRAARLLTSALWLGATSALVSIALYSLGAREVAVIELSVGAGLVTVLFVYAISIAGDESAAGRRSALPRLVVWGLAGGAVLLLGWLALPLPGLPVIAADASFKQMLWQQRAADVLLQIVLLFIGAVGVLGLLAHTQPLKDETEPQPRPAPKARPVPLAQAPQLEAVREEAEV